MSLVILSSGGLDSTLTTCLAIEQGLQVYPLFVDYGQLAKEKELNACIQTYAHFGYPEPYVVDLSGFGSLYPSGLTTNEVHIYNDAFLPGRNMLFLLAASTYACAVDADSISISLLSEELSLFPDQTRAFIEEANTLICRMTGKDIEILAPLINFSKKDVVELASMKGIIGTYSCHSGHEDPCGICIACKEYDF